MHVAGKCAIYKKNFKPFFTDILHTLRKCSANYRKGEKTAVTEIDATMKNKWNLRWLEEKVKTNVTFTGEKDHVSHEVELCVKPGQAFCAWCHEIIRFRSKVKIAHYHSSQENFPRTSLCPRRSLIKIQGTHWHTVCTSLIHWNRNSPPSSLTCAWSRPSKLGCEECVYFLKFCNMRQPEKVGTVSPMVPLMWPYSRCHAVSSVMFTSTVIFWFWKL